MRPLTSHLSLLRERKSGYGVAQSPTGIRAYRIPRPGNRPAGLKQVFVCALFLIASLVQVTGCVTTGPAKPSKAVAQPESTGPSVQRLADGREGFIVKEIAQLNDADRDKFDKAVKLMGEESFEPAIALLEEVVAQSPAVTAPYINLAIAYAHMDKQEKAEAQLKKALALFPGHPLASNEYGLLLRKAGKFDEARKIYEQSLEKFPEYAPLHRNLGILCDLYLNDLVCAGQQYEIYSEAAPDDKKVQMWIADLKQRMGSN